MGGPTNVAQKSNSSLSHFHMSSNSRASLRTRGLSPEVYPIYEIGRRKVVIQIQQTNLRCTLSDSASSIVPMTSFTFKIFVL
jgi:hypothetical protein